MYRVWGDATWNGLVNQQDCAYIIKRYNIFTRRCDDIPDWRTPEQVKHDNEMAADQSPPRVTLQKIHFKRKAERELGLDKDAAEAYAEEEFTKLQKQLNGE